MVEADVRLTQILHDVGELSQKIFDESNSEDGTGAYRMLMDTVAIRLLHQPLVLIQEQYLPDALL